MEEKVIERIFAIGIEVGVINLARNLGLIDESVTARQAYKIYGERQVKEWRHKGWIVGYPTGNKSISKYYYKRSELETASRMLSMQNIIPASKINQILSQHETKRIETSGPKARQRGSVLR